MSSHLKKKMFLFKLLRFIRHNNGPSHNLSAKSKLFQIFYSVQRYGAYLLEIIKLLNAYDASLKCHCVT